MELKFEILVLISSATVSCSIAALDIEADVSKVEDIMQIMQYGVMNTPALVINGKVVLSGKLPNEKELKDLLTK